MQRIDPINAMPTDDMVLSAHLEPPIGRKWWPLVSTRPVDRPTKPLRSGEEKEGANSAKLRAAKETNRRHRLRLVATVLYNFSEPKL